MKDATPGRRAARKVGKALALSGATIFAGLFAATTLAAQPVQQVLFVCEHGNVKSLMAASYFNQLAAERKLPLQALSRGVAIDSTSVPSPIVAGLRAEGIEVKDFQPQAVRIDDATRSRQVVTIGTDLPQAAQPTGAKVEQWNDVPAASTNYAAARESLRAHVSDLVERLSRSIGNE
jgi:protein-tyrosine-phosphatase